MPTPPLVLILLLHPALAQDDPCAEPCALDGYCVQLEGVCQATTDAHCQAAWVCREYGHCFFVDTLPCSPGRCGPQDERDAVEASKPAARDQAAAGLVGHLAGSESGSRPFAPGWRDEPGLGAVEGVPSRTAGSPTTASPDASVGRPSRVLNPADIQCPMDSQRKTDKVAGEYTRTWCALPDGRKKGPELVVYAGQGQRMYTEYQLDQEHGEHVITETDGRVMVQGRYELGREEGLWESWYTSGGRASRGEYHAGKKVGIWTEWSRSGVEKRCDFRDPAVPDIQCIEPTD